MPVTDFQLSNFVSQMRDGARPNQFYVDLAFPQALQGAIVDGINAETKMRFYAKGATLPASTIGETPVPFRGANFKLSGDRTVADWTITINNDTDFLIRNALEQWSDYIIGNVDRDQVNDGDQPLNYMGTAEVNQLSRNGEILKTYTLVGVWPGEIGEITLDWGTNDTIEEFPVTFKVQWIESGSTRNNTQAETFSRTGGANI